MPAILVPPQPLRATKIVATLGPACSDEAMLERVIAAGVDVVRLNFSHGQAAEHIERARLARSIAARNGRALAVMADLQGPKIRISKFAGKSVQLQAGQSFTLDAQFTGLGDAERVGLDYRDLPRDVKAGDTLLLNDGLIVMQVQRVQGGAIHCQVSIGGTLSDNKGINKKGGGLSAPALTAKDHEDIRTAMALAADYLAVSFVNSAEDIHLARKLAREAAERVNPGRTPGLIAKIERAEAIPRLEEIIRASDGIMVARGDLAVEVGNAAVPALQKRMIRMAREHDRLVITATQMMESMITNPIPTRAEVSDVANAVLDGTDAVMLSAETAAGQYPQQTVEAMAAIALEAERAETVTLDADFMDKNFARIDQSIALGALFTAHHLHCKAIAALTESGSTPLWMSRYRIHVPIFAFTPQLSSLRHMALYRNVHPVFIEPTPDAMKAQRYVESLLRAGGALHPGDLYALTSGEPMGSPGGTNTLKILRME